MTVSLNLLTMGRSSMVVPTLTSNLEKAGARIDEIVWCDNGSEWHEFCAMRDSMAAHQKERGFKFIQVRHSQNLGAAPGYNRCAALSTSDLLLITGCDRVMPDNWLADMLAVMADADIAIASVYSVPPDRARDRMRGAPAMIGTIEVTPAMPFEARIYRRELLRAAGYLREDFGLYGWEDVEWSHRVLRVCMERGWTSVAITNMLPKNLCNHGHHAPDEYQAFKDAQASDPAKIALAQKCKRDGFPFYSPY